MWRTYLKSHISRSLKQEPFGEHLKKKLKEQFRRMTPMERWTSMSLIDNNKLVQIKKKDKSFVEETLEEEFQEDFEDTIYVCDKCGCKKIDLVQKQLRGAVSVLNIYVFCFFSICFASTGRSNDMHAHMSNMRREVDRELISI